MNFASALLFFLLASGLSADTGGPYQYVADPKKSDIHDTVGLAKQDARPLPFYLNNIPIIQLDQKNAKPQPLEWRKRKDGDPYISIDQIKDFPGNHCAISYVRTDLLKVGTVRKSGIMILAPTGKGLYRIAYFSEQGSSQLVETYSAETVKLLNDESFLKITCHFSGSGGHRSTEFFRWKNFKLTRHAVWSDELAFEKEIKAAGWTYWHRGHWNDPSKKIKINTVYRDPKDAKGGRSGHAQIRTDYEWKDEQLVPKNWSIVPEEK